MKKTKPTYGFTLIELLVVIAIIGLLAGLLFPAVSAALNTAKKAEAANTAQMIETAIMIYKNEYNGRLPISIPYGTDATNDSLSDLVSPKSKEIIKVLMNIGVPVDQNHALNPKGIVFLETKVATNDGTFLDPWGTQYKILLDRDLNGRITYLTTANTNDHRKTAVVVSAGRDRLFGNGTSGDANTSDNVANVDLPNK